MYTAPVQACSKKTSGRGSYFPGIHTYHGTFGLARGKDDATSVKSPASMVRTSLLVRGRMDLVKCGTGTSFGGRGESTSHMG
jgi:hypothetical protein